jgi:type VI protein secretion system component VasF
VLEANVRPVEREGIAATLRENRRDDIERAAHRAARAGSEAGQIDSGRVSLRLH